MGAKWPVPAGEEMAGTSPEPSRCGELPGSDKRGIAWRIQGDWRNFQIKTFL